MLKKLWKSQNPLSLELKRGTELEEHALSGLYHKMMHTKYSINKKSTWFFGEEQWFCWIWANDK